VLQLPFLRLFSQPEEALTFLQTVTTPAGAGHYTSPEQHKVKIALRLPHSPERQRLTASRRDRL